MRPIDCPSEGDLRAYLQRERGSDQTAGIETHLVGCRSCRGNLLNWQQEAEGVAERVPPKLKRRVARMGTARTSFFPNLTGWASSPFFATAAIVLIAVTAFGIWRLAKPVARVNPQGDVLRSDGRRVSSVRTVFPAENAVVSGPAIEFKWSTEAEVSRYTVEVLNADGEIIYQAVTSTDHVTVDTLQAQLHSHRKYYWHVKAKLADGTESETNLVPFSIGPK